GRTCHDPIPLWQGLYGAPKCMLSPLLPPPPEKRSNSAPFSRQGSALRSDPADAGLTPLTAGAASLTWKRRFRGNVASCPTRGMARDPAAAPCPLIPSASGSALPAPAARSRSARYSTLLRLPRKTRRVAPGYTARSAVRSALPDPPGPCLG